MYSDVESLRTLVRLRWRMALLVSVTVVVLYFGFILLIAFNKEAMATEIQPGLSIGIVLGALVIVLTWVTTWFYVNWAAKYMDREVERQNRGAK
jgi:uncharacterized membrane protein (DUF485 family)